MKNKLKKLLLIHFTKKEKTTKWNWILRIGVILFLIGALLTVSAIVLTILANNEELKFFGMEMNDASTYMGMASCLFATTGMFFIFCGKKENI